MAQSGSHPAPPGLSMCCWPGQRLSTSLAQNAHEGLLQTWPRADFRVSSSRSKSDSKLTKLLYCFFLKMSSRKRLSPSACGRASSPGDLRHCWGQEGAAAVYSVCSAEKGYSARCYSVLRAFCGDRRPTCVFGACLDCDCTCEPAPCACATASAHMRSCVCSCACICVDVVSRRGHLLVCMCMNVCMRVRVTRGRRVGERPTHPGSSRTLLSLPAAPPPFSIPPSFPRLHTTQCLPLCDRFRVRKDREQGRYCSVPAP